MLATVSFALSLCGVGWTVDIFTDGAEKQLLENNRALRLPMPAPEPPTLVAHGKSADSTFEL